MDCMERLAREAKAMVKLWKKTSSTVLCYAVPLLSGTVPIRAGAKKRYYVQG